MILSELHVEKLISNLENANVVNLIEEEEELFDEKGNIINRKYNDQPGVQFEITSKYLKTLYANFKRNINRINS